MAAVLTPTITMTMSSHTQMKRPPVMDEASLEVRLVEEQAAAAAVAMSRD